MFKRILFVSEGRDGDLEAMKQALVLAGANASSLDILVVHSGVPDASSTYLPAFEAFLAQQAETCLQQAQASGAPAPSGPVSVRVEGGHAPDVRIVQEVLRNGHDLVIKAAASGTDGRGFQALDMGLLRKCPVPLWLHRPRGGTESGSFQVAVAIDPRESKEGLLARHLLQLADGIADLLGARLSVLSCWDYALEGYLRNHVFASGSDDGQLQQAVTEERCRHRAELAKLIRLADLNTRPSIHHPRGPADQLIPDYVAAQGIDLLVMGTVARTGIPGFVIGNTAENLVRKIGCSLLALKPPGFISPVRSEAR